MGSHVRYRPPNCTKIKNASHALLHVIYRYLTWDPTSVHMTLMHASHVTSVIACIDERPKNPSKKRKGIFKKSPVSRRKREI